MSSSRQCTGEVIEVWEVRGNSLSELYTEASMLLHNNYPNEPFSNLVTSQHDTGDGLIYDGILYVHIF